VAFVPLSLCAVKPFNIMKTKTPLYYLWSLIFGLFLSPVPCALSQIPQGFNYQAVALTSAGAPISNTTIQIKMGILSDTLTPVVVWEELHSSVKTNLNGVFNLVIGTGARQSGSAAVFSEIDWKISPLYLKIQIYYQSTWKYLGSAKLWSVPYAMVAGNMGGPVSKFSVEGETSSSEEALFEVKNKDGQTIFAVYNEGVRIYVSDGAKALKGGFAVGGFGTDKAESTKYLFVGKDSVRVYLDTNPLTKKLKGGFAVGGYDLTKGTIQNYLDVNSDSVRIYIDSDPSTKKIKGGFAVGGYDMTKGNVQDYLDISPDSVRIYIDDTGGLKGKKGGFAVGGFDLTKGGNKNFLNVEIDTSGKINPSNNRILWYPLKNAFLTGKVLIESRDSVGENSFASGFESKSKGQYSQALGFKAIARGDYSTAIGKNSVANKINSFAFGEDAKARNEESYAIGRGAVASGYRSFAFGSAGLDGNGTMTDVARAIGNYSFAIGQGSIAYGDGSFALGIRDSAKGDFSTAMGYFSSAEGHYSTAIGHGALARGNSSISMGESTRALGGYSTALGEMTTSGYGATAMGGFTTASGDYSTAMGQFTTATRLGATSMGASTVASGYGSTAMGSNTVAAGDGSTAMGYYSISRPYASLAIGRYNDTTCSVNGSVNWVDSDPVFVIGNGTSNSARSNAFTILKNGKIGIGLLSPSEKLEIGGTSSKIYLNSAGTNTILFNSNGAAIPSFTTRSVGTKLVLYPSLDDINADYALGIGSFSMWFSIPRFNTGFAYRFFAGTSEVFTINGTGFADVSGAFRIKGSTVPSTGTGVEIYYSGGSGYVSCIDRTAGVYKPLYMYTAMVRPIADNSYSLGISTYRWTAVYAVNGTIQTSDVRLKNNIQPINDGLNSVMNLNPIYFNWTDKSDQKRHIGLVAQDVLPVIPEIVDIGDDPDNILGINYAGLVPVLVSAIKEQQQQIETQNQKIDQLIILIDELKEEIASSLRSSQ
jgi:hypothetical protein